MIDERIIENSIVQVNDTGHKDWIGCLIQVTDIYDWGIQGYVQIPKSGAAHIRLKWETIDYIGQAVMIQE